MTLTEMAASVFQGSTISRISRASGVTPWDGAFRVDLLDASVEILLFGFGRLPRRLPQDFATELKVRGIGHDSMDSGAACRTYNVLAAEGRRVAALLCRV